MRHSLLVGEVEQEAGRRRVDARGQRRLAWVADRPWRQAGVPARVVGRVKVELGRGRLGGQAVQGVEKRGVHAEGHALAQAVVVDAANVAPVGGRLVVRSEEHTSELQSPYDLVCRLLLEK